MNVDTHGGDWVWELNRKQAVRLALAGWTLELARYSPSGKRNGDYYWYPPNDMVEVYAKYDGECEGRGTATAMDVLLQHEGSMPE